MAFAILAIPGGYELFVVLGVILLLFGSTKLPKLARSLGSSVTEFKKGVKSGDASDDGGKLKDGDSAEPKGDSSNDDASSKDSD